MGLNTLVFRNALQDISDGVPGAHQGISIFRSNNSGNCAIPATGQWRTTLYANTCTHVDDFELDNGIGTVRYCPAGSTPGSCDCLNIKTVDIGVSASASSATVKVGASFAYTVSVANNGADPASAVALSIEPAMGIRIGSLVPSQGAWSCDSSVNLCKLGSLAAGHTAALTVNAVATTAGTWPVTFSATHRQADGAVANNSATVSTSAR